MKSRKISKSNAKLTEIEMEQVVGGFMTGYFFPFLKAVEPLPLIEAGDS